MSESYDPGQYEFHYNKEERLTKQSHWLQNRAEKGSFFKRNRNFLILFFDLLLLLLVFGIFYFFSDFGVPDVSGYHVRGRAFIFNDEALVSVTVSPRPRVAPDPARIKLGYSFSAEEDFFAIDDGYLDGTKDQSFRASVAAEPGRSNVYIHIQIAESSRIISIALEKE